MAIKSYSDITTNIPNMFLDSGAPTAPPSIIFSDFSSFSHSTRAADERPLGSRNEQKSWISKDFQEFL